MILGNSDQGNLEDEEEQEEEEEGEKEADKVSILFKWWTERTKTNIFKNMLP